MSQYSKRKPSLALLLSIFMPGLGHIYCGELIQGIALFFIFSILPLFFARIAVALPDPFMLIGMVVTACVILGVYLYALINSFKIARESSESHILKSYNSVLFYFAAILGGFALMFSADGYLKSNIIEAHKIVGSSMEPTVLRGDYVLTDKTAYKNQPIRTGDIVIAVYPDDRSKVLIRRVEGLPGETLHLSSGEKITIPHGSIMVKGTGSKEGLVDSRTFGPLDMRDVVGRVTQIYFSRGSDGIRWQRIGKLIEAVGDS